LDENWKSCNNELEQTLTLLHSDWSKEIEPSRQNSAHLPLIVSNPIKKKGSEFMRRNMQWEVPTMPMAAYDPRLLPEQASETPVVIGKTGSWTKRFQQVVSSESKTRCTYGKREWKNRKSSRQESDYIPGFMTRMDNH